LWAVYATVPFKRISDTRSQLWFSLAHGAILVYSEYSVEMLPNHTLITVRYTLITIAVIIVTITFSNVSSSKPALHVFESTSLSHSNVAVSGERLITLTLKVTLKVMSEFMTDGHKPVRMPESS